MDTKKLNKFLSTLFPVNRGELRKLTPMLTLLFLLSLIYNLLRPLKVAVTIAAAGSKSDVIPFLKVWGVLPGAIILTFIFTILSNRLTREQVFYAMLSLFMGFFILFALVLYPNAKYIELTTLANFLREILPNGASGFISMVQYWHLSICYVAIELWGSMVLSLLFWGFANEVNTFGESKRFYALLSLAANFSGVFSGTIGIYISHLDTLYIGKDIWDQSLKLTILLVVILCIFIVCLFRWMHISFGNTFNEEYHINTVHKTKKIKEKLSLLSCFKYVAQSKYLTSLAIIVFSYNMIYNLTDIVWMSQLELRFENQANDLKAYIDEVTRITGIVSVILGIFTIYILRWFGWLTTAIITPLGLLITSLAFFPLILFKDSMAITYLVDAFSYIWGNDILRIILFIGSTQKCITRACKFSVFDSSKEIAYTPISIEGRRKSKAAIDGIGSRMGKSSGSLMYQGLLICLGGSMAAVIPYAGAVIIIVSILWLWAVKNLASEIKKHQDENLSDN